MTDFKIEYVDALADNVDEKIHQGHVADEASNGAICNYKKLYKEFFKSIALCNKLFGIRFD